MTDPITVAILAGGLTHEREVSLHSGRRMATLLREAGMQVKLLDVDASLLLHIKAMSPDVIWPLIHGSTGEDGSLQDLLSLTGVPYVGSSPSASRLASDKAVASALVSRIGVSVPRSMSIPSALFREIGVAPVLELISANYSFPLVVKPGSGGSALGVTIVHSAADLPRAMVDCYAYSDHARIESYVEGRELAVSIMNIDGEPYALPPVEIATDGPYDYDARYNAGRSEYFVPARLPDEQLEAVREIAVRCHRELGLSYISRVDFIIRDDGEPVFIDINVAPGTTETSLLPQAVTAEAASRGVEPAQLYLDLLAEVARK
ncbi:MAG: D-alanine--D-alanine ligase family protein [Ancrocorticia sp.]|uniref:D-alanine--D-alanine ligase family protein n=1 Tax=Ancrocorticia sp. TaxID=2593684 RepID=UPI003F939418